ncbi:hypothetical protein MRX96_048026 [Rhipicephalus microplus]
MDLLTFVALDILAGRGDIQMLDGANPARDSRFSAAGPSSSASTASHSSGPAGSRAPASLSPAVPLQPRQSILDGDVLWVYLPAPAELQCPVGDRSMKYSGAVWTCRMQSVRRHVEFENGVRVNDRIYVCSVCDSPLTSRPSNHCCLATATLAPSTEAPRCRCSVCDVTFTSALGLANHLRCHVDQAGPSGAAFARSVRHVSSSTATSLSSSGSPPAAASRALRRLRGLAPYDAAPSVRPSSSLAAGAGGLFARVDRRTACLRVCVFQRFVDVRGIVLSPRFAGTISCCKPGRLRAAHARHRKCHVFLATTHRCRDARRCFRGFARSRVTTVTEFCVPLKTLVIR